MQCKLRDNTNQTRNPTQTTIQHHRSTQCNEDHKAIQLQHTRQRRLQYNNITTRNGMPVAIKYHYNT